jgi:hypothetical protein
MCVSTAMQALREAPTHSSRRHYMRVGGQRHAPAEFYLGKGLPVPTGYSSVPQPFFTHGTPQNFVLWKGGTNQYVDTKMRILYINPLAIMN